MEARRVIGGVACTTSIAWDAISVGMGGDVWSQCHDGLSSMALHPNPRLSGLSISGGSAGLLLGLWWSNTLDGKEVLLARSCNASDDDGHSSPLAPLALPSAMERVARFAVGKKHALLMSEGGGLWAMGENNSVSAGTPSHTHHAHPHTLSHHHTPSHTITRPSATHIINCILLPFCHR